MAATRGASVSTGHEIVAPGCERRRREKPSLPNVSIAPLNQSPSSSKPDRRERPIRDLPSLLQVDLHAPSSVGLGLGHESLRTVGIHAQQMGGELHPVGAPQGVQYLERTGPHRLRPAGVERHDRVRLQLEPADHAEDAGERPMGPLRGVLPPEVVPVPVGDRRALVGRNAERHQDLVDTCLMSPDVVRPQSAEVIGSVLTVVCEQRVRDEVAHVEDRTVDVEDDAQPLAWMRATHVLVVSAERLHPVGAGEGHLTVQRRERRWTRGYAQGSAG